MYDNGYIVKCRSILTNDICLSEASHKADVFLVCISYLTYSLKKCIDNLAVWKIRVNTHTHKKKKLSRVNRPTRFPKTGRCHPNPWSPTSWEGY